MIANLRIKAAAADDGVCAKVSYPEVGDMHAAAAPFAVT